MQCNVVIFNCKTSTPTTILSSKAPGVNSLHLVLSATGGVSLGSTRRFEMGCSECEIKMLKFKSVSTKTK
jgi:hypothetical protein